MSGTSSDSPEKALPSIPPNIQPLQQPRRERRCTRGVCHQFFTTTVISISYVICGQAIGWTSPVLYMMRYEGVPTNCTTTEESLMVSLFYVGNFVMPIPSGILSDLIGRKLSMMVLSSTAICSWILAYCVININILLVSRFLIGLWTGAVLTITPLYIGEISDPAYRGIMSSLITILVNVGALMALFITPNVNYYTVTLLFGLFPILMVLLFFCIPESPLWFVSKGNHAKARKSLMWLRAGKPQEEIDEELDTLSHAQKKLARPVRVMLRSKGTRKAIIIVEVLSILQRFCGASAVVGYASVTLPDLSFWMMDAMNMVGFIAIIWFSSALIHPFFIDRFGRKPLLIISSLGIGFTMILAAIYWIVNRKNSPQNFYQEWMAFVLFSLYGVFFNIGVGPVVPTIQGEMFPSDLKSVASGFTAMVLAGTSSITTATYPLVADHFGVYTNFIFYGMIGFITAAFTWFYVIETKGKSLKDIQAELHSNDLVPESGYQSKEKNEGADSKS